MAINDGGPAYPRYAMEDATKTSFDGLTVRDAFAIGALQGRLSSYSAASQHPPEKNYEQKLAQEAFLLADAMMAARVR